MVCPAPLDSTTMPMAESELPAPPQFFRSAKFFVDCLEQTICIEPMQLPSFNSTNAVAPFSASRKVRTQPLTVTSAPTGCAARSSLTRMRPRENAGENMEAGSTVVETAAAGALAEAFAGAALALAAAGAEILGGPQTAIKEGWWRHVKSHLIAFGALANADTSNNPASNAAARQAAMAMSAIVIRFVTRNVRVFSTPLSTANALKTSACAAAETDADLGDASLAATATSISSVENSSHWSTTPSSNAVSPYKPCAGATLAR
mmetsp:Transcript_21857/g.74110  ORF Transcript_21857/g.74110 Transcript_21857/m.74110 type:complete len:262 (+) Transcript_21857:1223-2008(+)